MCQKSLRLLSKKKAKYDEALQKCSDPSHREKLICMFTIVLPRIYCKMKERGAKYAPKSVDKKHRKVVNAALQDGSKNCQIKPGKTTDWETRAEFLEQSNFKPDYVMASATLEDIKELIFPEDIEMLKELGFVSFAYHQDHQKLSDNELYLYIYEGFMGSAIAD